MSQLSRTVLVVVLACTAAVLLTGCQLIGGGDSEELLALQEQLSSTKAMLDDTDRDVSAKQVRIAELQVEIKKVKDEAQAKALEGRISLEKARLEVVLYAQQNLAVYGPEFGNVPLVWEVATAEEDEEFYYVTLNYRPFANFNGTPGTEEFITDKAGAIQFRQVLTEPDPDTPLEEPPPEGKK